MITAIASLVIIAMLVIVAAPWRRRCRHDWRPEGFADWRCGRCGVER